MNLAVGAGGMILSFANVLKENNINFQEHLLVEATDISEICTYMTYLQLSLLGIPARVHCGNTLAMKDRFILCTPFFYRNYHTFRDFYYNSNKTNNENITESEITEEIKNIPYTFKEVVKSGNTQISFW